MLQSFSVNCSTNILNHGLKIDAKLQIGKGIVGAHAEILSVNKYSHPEHNIWIGRNYCKGVSLYTERIVTHFLNMEVLLETRFKPKKNKIKVHHSEVKGHTFLKFLNSGPLHRLFPLPQHFSA